MRSDERRIENLERHLATSEGCLGLTGAVYLVSLHVKQKAGEQLTDLERTAVKRLEGLPPSPELVEFCHTLRPDELRIGRIHETGDGRPLIINLVHYADRDGEV